MYRVSAAKSRFVRRVPRRRARPDRGRRSSRTRWPGRCGGDADLFGNAAPPPRNDAAVFSVAAGYVELAKDAICHRDPERFALLYTLLWRLTHGEKSLLLVAADPLVHRLRQMQKSVRRDAHKMTAFVRFRQVEDDDGERYVAWFEPEHHILRSACRRSSSIVSRPCAGRS